MLELSTAHMVTSWALLSKQGGKLVAKLSALNEQHCNPDTIAANMSASCVRNHLLIMSIN